MADSSEQIGQNEIEELLRKAQASPAASAPAAAKPKAEAESLQQSDIEALLKSGGAATPSPAPSKPAVATADSAIGQNDIEALLAQSASAPRPAAAPSAAARPATPPPANRPQNDIEMLLNHAQAALASATDGDHSLPPNVKAFRWEDFSGSPPSTDMATLDLLRDVELDLKIELGRTAMHLEDVLRLRKGSVVTLDKLAGDPVDIYVNGRLVARGEVLVLNDNFCVRVAELVMGQRVDAA